MAEEPVTVGRTEPKRALVALVLNHGVAGLITVGAAAQVVGRSARQVQRRKAAYQTHGPAAVVHGKRGRTPVWATPSELAARSVGLAQGPSAGCTQQHLTEVLVERQGLVVSRSTVRRVLLAAGVATARPRCRATHRQRRERMSQEGMLLHADGSPHPWLGSAGPTLTLLAMIDDATRPVLGAVFRAQADGAGYLLVVEHIVRAHGIPLARSVERHGSFQANPRRPLTIP